MPGTSSLHPLTPRQQGPPTLYGTTQWDKMPSSWPYTLPPLSQGFDQACYTQPQQSVSRMPIAALLKFSKMWLPPVWAVRFHKARFSFVPKRRVEEVNDSSHSSNLKKEKEEGKEIQLSGSININETARGRGTSWVHTHSFLERGRYREKTHWTWCQMLMQSPALPASWKGAWLPEAGRVWPRSQKLSHTRSWLPSLLHMHHRKRGKTLFQLTAYPSHKQQIH